MSKNKSLKSAEGGIVTVGTKPLEHIMAELEAEFRDLAPKIGTQPPKGAATVAQLAKVWSCSRQCARLRVNHLVETGQMKIVGKFLVPSGNRGSYPTVYYARAARRQG